MTVKENQIIKGVELAKLLGLSERHIRRLSEENIVKKNGQGKYLLLESTLSYIEYLKTVNSGDVDLKDEKIKTEITKNKRDIELKSLKIAELKNQLHSAIIIEEVMTSMLLGIKGKLLSIPNKLAPMLIGIETLGEIQDIIQESISDSLVELIEYSPELFKNKNYIDELEDEELISIKKIKKESKNEKKRGRPKKS